MKQCSKCKRVKPLSEFYPRSTSPDGYRTQCKQCEKEYTRQWKADNAEKIQKYMQQWRDENSERVQETTRTWRESNPEKVREMHRRYYRNHTEEIKERVRQYAEDNPKAIKERSQKYCSTHREEARIRSRQWREDNREKHRAYTQQWAKDNPEKAHHNSRQGNHNRRAREVQAEGHFTIEEFKKLCEQYNNRCLCCGEVKKLTVDHIVPLSEGGSNDISNIQPLCKSCNCRKSTKTTNYHHNSKPEVGNGQA